ncbi:Crp/Fnr family transcriptional regulator [Streptomyces paradoxus]|uniref:Crp/Fnr family transcriptional regulator n=1 Tax=Streptomyces paradoxus TaxID=66375 RepID=UPI0036E983F6
MSTVVSQPRQIPRRRGVLTRRAVASLFGGNHLTVDTYQQLEAKAVVRSYSRGEECLKITARRVFFLVAGYVREELSSGAVRVWAAPTVFPYADPRPSFEGRGYMLAPIGSVLSIGVDDLHAIGGKDPKLAFAIMEMSNARLRTMERVYGADRRSAKARVAGLIQYLATATDWDLPKDIEPRSIFAVDGPSQLDMANALGLGVSTVENVIAELRADGALVKPQRGERTNRLYQIADHLKLAAARIV